MLFYVLNIFTPYFYTPKPPKNYFLLQKAKNNNFHFFILQLKKMIYFCTRLQGRYNMAVRVFPVSHWRDGRVVECGGLENRCTERYRGFESLSLRKQLVYNTRNQCFRVLVFSFLPTIYKLTTTFPSHTPS